MQRPTRFAPAVPVLAALALVLVAAGCGVSSDAVLEALPATTAVTVPETTSAPDTTAAPDTTSAPDTTAAPDTTDAPATSPPATTGGGGGSGNLPEQARQAFMESCQSGGQATTMCTCIWDAIESQIDMGELLSAGSTGTIPPDLQQKIVEATMGCLSTTGA